jgi:hypothetical protein
MAIPEDNVDGTVGRINGSNTRVGTLYNSNCNLYNIYVIYEGAVDLRTEDSYGEDNAVVDGVIESIVKELNPLAWFAPNDNDGIISVVMDKSINDAADIQRRIRDLSPVGPNETDISGTTVWAATSIPPFGDNS